MRNQNFMILERMLHACSLFICEIDSDSLAYFYHKIFDFQLIVSYNLKIEIKFSMCIRHEIPGRKQNNLSNIWRCDASSSRNCYCLELFFIHRVKIFPLHIKVNTILKKFIGWQKAQCRERNINKSKSSTCLIYYFDFDFSCHYKPFLKFVATQYFLQYFVESPLTESVPKEVSKIAKFINVDNGITSCSGTVVHMHADQANLVELQNT